MGKKKSLRFANIYGNGTGVQELIKKDFFFKKNKKILLNISNINFIKPKNKKFGFILFYTPWCKHCNNMKDIWSELAIENINNFYFGSVNCENLKEGNDYLSAKLKVTAYPTIMVINKNGRLTEYIGSIERGNLLFYIQRNI